MSLTRFSKLSPHIANIIIYVPSDTLGYQLKQKLRIHYKMHPEFIVNVDTVNSLIRAKADAHIAPMFCERWLIHVDADKFSRTDINKVISNTPAHGVTVYWISQYRTFKLFEDNAFIKAHGVYNPVFSFSRLSYGDIKTLYRMMVGDKGKLDSKLLDYVAKTYKYDVQAVSELFVMLRSGNTVTSRKEIIELVGVGGNSISSFVVKILTTDFSKLKRKDKVISRQIRLLEDLASTYKYSTIRKYMISTVNVFLEMKQLQIMGIYGRKIKEIPENFNIDGIERHRRFERVLLNDITLPRLVNFKVCLEKYKGYKANYESYDDSMSGVAIIQAISEFYNSIYNE